jgi:hypothetical protein
MKKKYQNCFFRIVGSAAEVALRPTYNASSKYFLFFWNKSRTFQNLKPGSGWFGRFVVPAGVGINRFRLGAILVVLLTLSFTTARSISWSSLRGNARSSLMLHAC